MLQHLTKQTPVGRPDAYEAYEQAQPVGGSAFGVWDVVAMLRRRALLIAGVAALTAAAAIFYAMLETPRYAAAAVIVLDSSKARPNEEIASLVTTGAGTDQTMADSQVEVIKSESIAAAVIDTLKLDQDQTFYQPRTLLAQTVARLRGFLGRTDPLASPRNLALEAAQTGLTAERVGTSYAIRLSYEYPDPARSAEITNAFVDAYQASQIRARDQQSERTTAWLQTRLAELRKKSLDVDAQMQELRRRSGGEGAQTLALLRDLERESETYRSLYQTFLSRHQQVVEQESLTIDQARVVTRARAPIDPVYPRKSLFLALSLFVGAALGLGAAIALEALDGRVRNPADVTSATGLSFLGFLPAIKKGRARGAKPAELMDHVAREPESLYADSLRSLWRRVEGIPSSGAKVIGFCSISPGPAAAITTSNFAYTVAALGRRTLLVEADTRRSTLADAYTSRPLAADTTPNLHFANLAEQEQTSIPDARIPSLADGYDCLAISLPPLGMADAAALARSVDRLVLVVEWAEDEVKELGSAVGAQDDIYDKWLGALLTGVNIKTIDRYDQSGQGAMARRLNNAYFGRRSGKVKVV